MIDCVRYKKLIRPSNLLKEMSISEFQEWALDGTIKDLECTLIELEKEDMFEHCMVIKELLKVFK